MSNPRPSITFDGDAAVFEDNSGRVVRVSVSDMRKLYHVRSGSDLYANDEEFWVLETNMTFVVIPDDEMDMIQVLLRAWKAHVDTGTDAYEALCALPPPSWRIKRLGFLPSTKMKFSIFPPERFRDLDGWKVLEPLALDLYCS
jgi:hypothetical protein